jgi:hypothetical protein
LKIWPFVKAFGEGKNIILDGNIYDNMSFTAPLSAYKIAPEPKYRPFKNAEEFAPYRDKWVLNKIRNGTARITAFNDVGFFAPECFFEWSNAFEKFTFEDGSPFGILDNDEEMSK